MLSEVFLCATVLTIPSTRSLFFCGVLDLSRLGLYVLHLASPLNSLLWKVPLRTRLFVLRFLLEVPSLPLLLMVSIC